LKILVFSNNNNFLTPILKVWEKLGIDFDLFQMRPVSSIQGFRRFKNSLANRFSLAALKRRLHRYDVCYAEWAEAAYYLTRVLKTTKPIVARLIDPFTPYHEMVDYSKITQAITIGESPKRFMKIPQDVPLTLIPPTIADPFFEYQPKTLPDPLNICTVGFRESRKQIYSAILTVKELREDLKLDLKFNIVGHGGPDERYIKLLTNRFPWLSITKWIDDIIRFYAEQNIYLCHSYYESFGVAMVEAMVCGAIPLAHQVLIANDVLPEKKLYYSSYRELKQKMKHYLNLEPQARKQLTQKYRAFAQSKYATAKIAKDMLEVLKTASK
jgi:hypothetical protein